jgi:hypothetical protein
VSVDEVLLNARGANNTQLKGLLSVIFRYCVEKPSFSTSFCEALRTVSVDDGFLETLSNELKLSAAEKVLMGLALSDSESMDLSVKGKLFGKTFSYSMYCQLSHSRCICNSFALQGRNLQLLRLRSYPQILLILCQMTKFRRLLCFFSRLKASQSI